MKKTFNKRAIVRIAGTVAAIAMAGLVAAGCSGEGGGGQRRAEQALTRFLAESQGGANFDAAAFSDLLGGISPESFAAILQNSPVDVMAAAMTAAPADLVAGSLGHFAVGHGGNFAYDLNATGDGIIITAYRGPGGVVVIPATIEGFPVVEIGNRVFVANIQQGRQTTRQNLVGVVIPNSVTRIGDEAFRNLRSLTSITLPNGLTHIGNHAFAGAHGLTSVRIPDSVTHIGESAFWSMNSLRSINLPLSLTVLGDAQKIFGSFSNNRELVELIIPYSLDLAPLIISVTDWGITSTNAHTFEGSMGRLPLATRARLTDAGFTQ